MSDGLQDEAVALMAAVARGERRALRPLIGMFSAGLAKVATRYLGSAEEADEVVQDVFLRVWRHAGRYDPAKAQVRTWLYRIAVNLCIDRQRKRSLLRFVGLEGAAAEVADPEPSAEARLSGAEELATVRRAIDGLPARQRMALLLQSVGEMDVSEVAGAMGVSEGAVEQLLVRARRTLRATLERRRG